MQNRRDDLSRYNTKNEENLMIKVFRVVEDGGNNEYVSPVMRGMAKVIQRKNEIQTGSEWLTSKGYYPTVFLKKEQAIQYKKELDNDSFIASRKVLLCETTRKDIISDLPQMCLPNLLISGMLAPVDKNIFPEMNWPVGTVMVRKMKMIREIECNNQGGINEHVAEDYTLF
jgi:hypothetical protein